jgi:DNA polymerase III sliding clamp (beta) subunit (PCNA family)
MKTLIKLAKSNGKYIPILKTILVKDGRALSTNMDMICMEPTDKKDGLYYAEGFEAGLTVDLPVTDFPTLADIGKAVEHLELPLKDLEYVAVAMATEVHRYYLCGVHFKGSIVEATDGHMLNQIHLPEDFDMPSKIIPSDAIKYAIAAAKENKVNKLDITLHEKGFTIKAGKTMLQGKLIDGTLPDTDRVIPKVSKHTIEFRGKDIAEELKLAKIKAKCSGLDYNSFVLTKPIRIGFNIGYLEKLIDGTMHVNDASSPVKVVNGNRLSVLMPMRV